MAFAITMIAQFGYRNNLWNEKIGKIIRVNREPNWNLQDFYLQSSEGNNQVSFPFPKKERQISPQKQLAKEIMDLLNNIDKMDQFFAEAAERDKQRRRKNARKAYIG